ncbi:ABC transporter substrate-binding protein [Corticibacterium sp. UT-5YL-CI-8]|nr:ABC transporter substrate-binding protein [Tianweitania sp. UT-5YL-CI-8]
MKKHVLGLLVTAALSTSALSALAATPADQLVVGMSMNNVLTLDPAAMSGRESTGIVVNIYDTLIQLDPIERTKVNPGLAESWNVADDGTITFNLREGATFNSGNPVTAEDVVWSIKRNIGLGLVGAGVWSSFGYTKDNVDQHIKADGNTITVTLPQPSDPNLILYIFGKPDAASVLDKKTVLENETNGDMGAAWLTTNAAGSGPFTLTNWAANDILMLQRAENYWGGPAPMKRIIFRHMPESQTKRLMLERGDLDIALALSVPDINALSTNKDVVVQATPSAGFYFLAVSMKDERFQKEDVRLALRNLIDYQGINQTIMPNYGIMHLRPVSPGVLGSLPNPDYKLDAAKAKEYLAKAGYADGFPVKLLSLNEAPFIDIATSIQGTLAQAGIKADIVTGTGNQVYGPMRERKFELIVGRGGGGQEPHPHSNLRALVINPNNSDDAGLSGVIGWRTSFFSEELNTMAQQALVERDKEKQKKLYEDIQYKYEELVPALQPISAAVDTVVFRSDIQNYQNHYGWTTRLHDVDKAR